MATGVIVIGDSGSGKSTSIGNIEALGIVGLNPAETVIINAKGKPLPFHGWKNKYKDKITEGGNYFSSVDSGTIIQVLEYISANRPDIKNVVIDDYQYIISDQFMRDALQAGFDKFNRLAKNAYDIIKTGLEMREDMNFIMLTHSDEENGKYKMKTIGKMLDEKINPIGLFTIALFTTHKTGLNNTTTYHFVTNQHLDERGYIIPAKSPYGMFTEKLIPNDMGFVIDKIKKYNEGD